MASVPSTPVLGGALLEAGHLDEVQAFVAVAQCGSFTAAAGRLERNASTVSRRVAALEARLGVRLVARTTRRVALTEAGTSYLARMTAVLEEIAHADAEMAAHGDVPQGSLRISLPRAYGRLWVAPLLPVLMARYPTLRIQAHYADHFVDLVGEGYDVAVRLGKLADSTLVARKVAAVRRRMVASPAYLAKHGTPARPEDLLQHRCLGFAGFQRRSSWILRQGLERREIAVPLAMTSDDAETLVMAAAQGAGIAVATDWLLDKHPDRDRLLPVLPEWDVGEESAIHLVTPSVRFVPAKTRAFVELAMQALRRDPVVVPPTR
ncbi:MAG TPA: LysR family transcriptional regulator [Ramlibacter sp.]|uniref:LysR family transcriptional regulator n=1 Tax=Ramlibacter sp. TaxID=1917967 RepID=UPI002D4C753A|nr:LysR family transcriptional regulator [Ramlibacter sp.]HZY17815.1 LysR family transcriptional regulator [Ramlibacter sp.]